MNKKSWTALSMAFTVLAAGCSDRKQEIQTLLPDHAVAQTAGVALVRQFSSGNIYDITRTEEMIAADPQRYLPVAQQALIEALLNERPTAVANLLKSYDDLLWRGNDYRGTAFGAFTHRAQRRRNGMHGRTA
jgi:hypothetical protein